VTIEREDKRPLLPAIEARICAAMICQLSFRLNQVSVQIKERGCPVPSLAFRAEVSLP
jgi:hypothetical protein